RVVQVEQLGPLRCDEAAVDIDPVDEAHSTLSQRTMNLEIGHCCWPDKVYNSAWSGAGIWSMRSSGLIELDAVLAVARHRGFRAGGTALGLFRSAVSHAVAALE